MNDHKGKRLFITGIPTAGKSYLAKKLSLEVKGTAICLDDFREELASNPRYQKWVNFYQDQDENVYLAKTDPVALWQNLVTQSEVLWSAFAEKIQSYRAEEKPVIFESVNILPHLARKHLGFPGIVLLGGSFEETLSRNKKNPRWGRTPHLQELEAKTFFKIERPRYKAEAEKYGYPAFEIADEALETAIIFLT